MKIFRSPVAALALAIATLAPLHAATEKEAIAAFKSDIEKLDAEAKAKQAQQATDPAAGVAMVRQMCKRLRAVRTEGLPADLNAAYADLVSSLGKFEKVFEGFPETGAEFQTFLQTKVTTDPTFLQKFQTDLASVTGEIQPKVKTLDDLGKKYGIDNLGDFGKGVAK
jgi:Skp family chaperone for outer membrane proteins